MIQLFNGMQHSLSLVYDREMGSMRAAADQPAPLSLAAHLPAAGRGGGAVVQVYGFC